jgi:hypothetical protein
MDSKIRQNEPKTCPPASVSQIQVRSDVRSGGDLETCQFNLNKWRERYYYWYDVARQKGKI